MKQIKSIFIMLLFSMLITTCGAAVEETTTSPTPLPSATLTPVPTKTQKPSPTPIHPDLLFSYDFSSETDKWNTHDVSVMKQNGKLMLSGPSWGISQSEYYGGAASPDTSLAITGDFSIEITIDRVIRWGGFWLGLEDGPLGIVISSSDLESFSLGILRPQIKDNPWDNVSWIDKIKTPLHIKATFIGDTLSIYINNELQGSRNNPEFLNDIYFSGIYVGKEVEFGIINIDIWGEEGQTEIISS